MSIAIPYDKLNYTNVRFVSTTNHATERSSRQAKRTYKHVASHKHPNANEAYVYSKLVYATPIMSMTGLTVIFTYNSASSIHQIKEFEECIISHYTAYASDLRNKENELRCARMSKPNAHDERDALTYRSIANNVHRIVAEIHDHNYGHGHSHDHFILRVNGVNHNVRTNHISLSYRVY